MILEVYKLLDLHSTQRPGLGAGLDVLTSSPELLLSKVNKVEGNKQSPGDVPSGPEQKPNRITEDWAGQRPASLAPNPM